MAIVTNLNSKIEMARERNANPNESAKLTEKLISPIIPTPKIPQKSIKLVI